MSRQATYSEVGRGKSSAEEDSQDINTHVPSKLVIEASKDGGCCITEHFSSGHPPERNEFPGMDLDDVKQAIMEHPKSGETASPRTGPVTADEQLAWAKARMQPGMESRTGRKGAN